MGGYMALNRGKCKAIAVTHAVMLSYREAFEVALVVKTLFRKILYFPTNALFPVLDLW